MIDTLGECVYCIPSPQQCGFWIQGLWVRRDARLFAPNKVFSRKAINIFFLVFRHERCVHFFPFKKIVEKCRIKLLPLYIFLVIYYTCLGIIQFEITTQQHIHIFKRNSAKNKQAKQRSHVIFLICNDSIFFFTKYDMYFMIWILYIHDFSLYMV